MSHEILVDNNEDALKLSRSAYYGGRSECWYVGKSRGDYYLVDVNSMYASVMRNLRVPVKLRGYTNRCTTEDLAEWCDQGTCAVHVDIKTDVPVFPMRDEHTLIFTVGKFQTFLAGEEIQVALEMGCITKIHACAVYKTEIAFKSFVEHMWSYRRAAIARGDTATADKYKMLLASFYGKWGQSGGVWEKIDDTESTEIKTWLEIDYDTMVTTEFRQFGGIVQRRSQEAESSDSSPAIAACITAAARMKLWRYICDAGRDNVFYMDTDSLLVNRAGLDNLTPHIRPDMLGGLRLEGSFSNISIHCCKDYVFDLREKKKGVSANAYVINDDTFECTQKTSLSAMIRGGDMGKAVTRKVSKRLVRSYNKGVIGFDGRVEPIRRD